ncbi:MAG: peptide chain release factor N(5)-glutamine methyltransferase [Planctomycetota bacterium]|nr:peptide chain release factor N(5)-glutamine methyltransferase [Planctomycetota bacterium]MEE2938880.1 peptide chain release factor N(5)-glutamine methyltransferase [Planctomycetota bacterium]
MSTAFLERKGLENPRLEADLLVAHALGIERLQLYMRLDQPLLAAEVDRARDLLVRRGRREPTAYIVGHREFYGRDFQVGPGVLVPRPETELLVDRARELLAGYEAPRVLDVGTGSGCIAVTLALELGGSADVHAVDISADALEYAEKNGVRLGAAVTLHEGDGLETLRRLAADRPFDLVISNPPYVEPGEAAGLDEEVRGHEPAVALYAPEGDPDRWARALCELAGSVLEDRGALLVELGHLQAARASDFAGPKAVVHDDLSGVPRVLELRPGA